MDKNLPLFLRGSCLLVGLFLTTLPNLWAGPPQQACEGGMVTTADGMNTVYTCPGDEIDDIIAFDSTGVSGENFTYIVTDENGMILGIPGGDMQNFEGAGEGVCLVWGLAYSGTLTAEVGGNASTDMLSDDCFNLSDNFVTVYRAVPDGGKMILSEGESTVYTCAQDGTPDVVNFEITDHSNSRIAYVITSPTLEILGITTDPFLDFDGAPPGTCWVWGLAYTGELTAQVGDQADQVALSSECFDLSDNFISVVRDVPNGGSIATPEGENEVFTCTQDGMPDMVHFELANTSNSKIAYIITSPTLEILGIELNDFHDFDNAPPGTCWVWGLAYTGELTAQVGDQADQVDLSSDCFDLSENFIAVVRTSPNGGMIATPDGENEVYTCTQDGTPDVVDFALTGNSEDNIAYIITSPTLEILGIELNDFHDFDDAPPGICWVWGLAYSGELTAQVGDQADQVALASGCFDLSDNFIAVNRDMPEGGTVSMPSGATERYTCTQDGTPDVVQFVNMGASNSKYAYIITSPTLEILGIELNDFHDFDNAPPGTCWVWGLAYTGEITAQVGDQADQVDLTDECFDLSDNFIAVVRDMPEGGTVSMPSGATERYTCTQDGTPDTVRFVNMGTSNSKYAYIITSPTLEILGIELNDFHDFDGAPPGTCWVWGLAYTGELTAQVGDQADQVDLASDCFDLSDNFIAVIRDMPDGGTVSMPSGATERYTCAQDGTPDVVQFQNMGASNSPYAYVITSPTLEILGITTDPFLDFDGAPPGTCWVWGLAYTGEITAQVGDQADQVDLASECFDLSDNFISVFRDVPDGGTIATEAGATEIEICVTGAPAVYSFVSEGTSNSNFRLVVTDDNNIILGLPPANMVDFGGAGSGVCRVWGLSYTGMFTAKVGDNAAEVALTDDCFDLSDNFVTVVRTGADAGTLRPANTPGCFDGMGERFLKARFDQEPSVPAGYEVLYVLTKGTDLVIQKVSDMPVFGVREAGLFTIHTLVYDPATLDLSIVQLGVTTGGDVAGLIADNGICADLDVTGLPIVIEACTPSSDCMADAGTLRAGNTPGCFDGRERFIKAREAMAPTVPQGYQKLFVLTKGDDLVIQRVNAEPVFGVRETGLFTIHTLVYDPATLDLSVIQLGVTTGADVLGLIAANDICASLDVTGYSTTIEACEGTTERVAGSNSPSGNNFNRGLEIYPNPATKSIWLKSEVSGDFQVRLYQLGSGKVQLSRKMELNASGTRMDVSGWVPGMYLVQIIGADGEMTSHRLVIQR